MKKEHKSEDWMSKVNMTDSEAPGCRIMQDAWRTGIEQSGEGTTAPQTVQPKTQIKDTTKSFYPRICHLTLVSANGTATGGTGFMVAPRTVLTAAHNLLDKKTNNRPVKVHVIPGRNGKLAPFDAETAAPTQYRIHPQFEKLEVDPARNYDWGAIILKKDFKVGFFQLSAALSDAAPPNWPPHNAYGYPTDKAEGTLWKSVCQITKVAPMFVFYNGDVTHGLSGGPALSAEIGGSPTVRLLHVANIDTGTQKGKGIGLRFTAEFMKGELAKWCQAGT